VMARRLDRPPAGDDVFVRRQMARLAVAHFQESAGMVERLAADDSEAVRLALAGNAATLPAGPAAALLGRLLTDASAKVRAAAALEVPAALRRHPGEAPKLAGLLEQCLTQESDGTLLAAALEALPAAAGLLAEHESPALRSRPGEAWLPLLSTLRAGDIPATVRRRAAAVHEWIWVHADPQRRALGQRLKAVIERMTPGTTTGLARRLIDSHDADTLGRVLAVLSQEDFGLAVTAARRWRRPRLHRGHPWRFRWWRLAHELRRPATNKRQGVPHTVGRRHRGEIRAPSGVLAEMNPSSVPAEPLYIREEDDWRPWLPMPDELLAALNAPPGGRPLRLVTGEGVTELRPPRSPLRRLLAAVRLTGAMAHYSELRNRAGVRDRHPGAYAEAVRGLGFELSFRGHAAAQPGPARFFSVALLAPLADFWSRFRDYSLSFYENSAFELLAFISAATAAFIGRHLWIYRGIRRARGSLALVIGGWGTRGKSGTERLKAALFNAMGVDVVSKTTGSEAMFVQARAHMPLKEMFLFRPYEKATIWEQVDVTRYAAQYGADVLLWECMGLNPRYVRILQRQWMRDDLSTITNAYPDHEDYQGPAGINVAEAMTEFIPPGGVLLTSEPTMFPVLEAAARARGARLRRTNWWQAGLLPDELLARFPYAEHPNNVALVLALADELGIDRDFALKEMADRVVPDAGVLKRFRPARVDGRRLELVNGMAANERLGCLENWRRTGFEAHDPSADPGTSIAALVNNRADRVVRSKSFAAILVNDLEADRYYLVGSNLEGLQGYIDAAWRDFERYLTLDPDQGGAEPTALLDETARRMRMPMTDEHVRRRLAAMAGGLAPIGEAAADGIAQAWRTPEQAATRLADSGVSAAQCDAVVRWLEADLQALDEYRALREAVLEAEAAQSLDDRFRALARQWFERKLVVVPNAHISGDALASLIAGDARPGVLTRLMGIQNIKGPGLELVYRWQAWEQCARACDRIESGDPAQIQEGLGALSVHQDFGVLSQERVRSCLGAFRETDAAQRESIQATIQVTLSNLERQLERLDLRAGGGGQGLLAAVLGTIEAFLDAGEAIRRRRRARAVYQALARERISTEHAAFEIRQQNKRQQGGWLLARLRRSP